MYADYGFLYWSITCCTFTQTTDFDPFVGLFSPGGRKKTYKKCYHMIQSDATLAAIPSLFYASPIMLAARAVGAPFERQVVDQYAALDKLIGQMHTSDRMAIVLLLGAQGAILVPTLIYRCGIGSG
jgi:hypothetical protein